MIKIKLNPLSPTIYNGFIETKRHEEGEPTVVETPYNFTWDITTDTNNINVKLTNDTEETIQYNFVIPYENIKQNLAYNTQTLFAITDAVMLNLLLQSEKTPYTLTETDLIEVTSITAKTKSHLDTGLNYLPDPADSLKLGHGATICVFKIFVPYKDCSISDLKFIIKYPDTDMITVNFNPAHPTELLETNIPTKCSKFFDNLTITADNNNPVAGDNILLTITAEETNITQIYVQQIVGTVNKLKVNLTNGVGTLMISTLGLDAGDTVEVKFGYKSFSSIKKYTKTLA
jgi:hypothetical protein